MKQQRILMEWPTDRLILALETVIDEQQFSPLRKRIMTKKLKKLAKRGELEVANLDTEWLYRLCAASLMQHDYHWFAWEWRSQWAARLSTGPWVYPRWFGVDDAQKRILVVAEQGIGDEIVFASCYHELAEDVEEAWIEVDPRLIPIFTRSFPENLHFVNRYKDARKRIVPRMHDYPEFHKGLPIEAFIPAGNVPKLYRQGPADFPKRRGFLRPNDELVGKWLAWIEPEVLVRFYKREGWSWLGRQGEIKRPENVFSLQYGNVDHGAMRVPPINLKWDFEDVFALITALGKVVTTTNAVAHMAGALGVATDCIKPPPIYATKDDGFNNRVQPWWPRDWSDWYPCVRMYASQAAWKNT